jgi:hypothetical protein
MWCITKTEIEWPIKTAEEIFTAREPAFMTKAEDLP